MSTLAQSVNRAIGAIVSRLFLVIALLELAIVMYAAITLHQDRTHFEERAITYSENLVKLLSRDLNSSFARIDLMLLVIKEEEERLLSLGGTSISNFQAFADRQFQRQVDVSGIVVTDEFGAKVYGSSRSDEFEPNYADRDYFTKIKSDPESKLVISKPLLGKRTGTWQIVFARRVNTPGGAFAGIVLATVPLELFQKQFSKLNLGPKSAINLRDVDLATVTRYPDTIPTSTGNPTVSKEWREKLKENPEFGSYFAVGLDNLGRAISFQKIGQFSHYIIVGLYPPDFLEPWARQVRNTIVLAIVAILLVALLGIGARKLANAWFELKSAEEDVRRINAELDQKVVERTAQFEAANRELEAFSYSVSHDLRGPLRSMDGFSLVLLEDYGDKLDEEGKDALQRIRAATQRMGSLIDDLLRLSRVTRAELHVSQVDLSAIACEIADAIDRNSTGRSVEWVIAPGLSIRADQALMRIAMQNLLQNAWKFTGKTDKPAIRVGALEREAETVYFVADNGVGFDMAHAANLFGAFQRLHHVDDFPGTGIGLAIVQRIIRRHEGKIWAEAKAGEGATFFFSVKEAEHGSDEQDHPAG